MLKKDIGTYAGIIWRHLSERGKLSIHEISELTDSSENLVLMALGWLARENKIHFSEKNGDMYVELNASASEMYY